MVDDREGVDSGEHEVLSDFVAEGADGDEEDVGVADFFLGLHAPEADLSVVEGDFVWGVLVNGILGVNARMYLR